MVTVSNRAMVGGSSLQKQQRQGTYGNGEMAAEKVGGAAANVETMNNGSSKVGAGFRWSGDAVLLRRRRVGLSSGGSVSDGTSDDDEEEEVEEDFAEELSDDGEGIGGPDRVEYDHSVVMNRGGSSRGRRERDTDAVGFDDAGTEDEDLDEPALPDSPVSRARVRESSDSPVARGRGRESPESPVARGRASESPESPVARGSGSESPESPVARGRGRESLESPVGRGRGRERSESPVGRGKGRESPDSPVARGRCRGSSDSPVARGRAREILDSPIARGRGRDSPDSPMVKERGRERIRAMSSPEEGREASDDSDVERPLPVSRGVIERSGLERDQASVSGLHREVIIVPEKSARGTLDTAKRKLEATAPRNGESKKRERAPSTSRRRRTNGTGERTRFSTDNKARVTLERAREILAAVKAAMMKDPKHFAMRHAAETHAVENSSSSEDDRLPMQLAPPRAMIQQVKVEEKAVKKRIRGPKGDKEAPARRRKPKVELDYHASEDKNSHRRPQTEGSVHEHAFKLGHFSAAGVEVTREGRALHDGDVSEACEKKEFHDDGYEQQLTVVEKKVRKRRKTKDAEEGLSLSTGLCPGSAIRNENWEPPTSPFGLIQESLYKDPWKVLLSCMLLNKTAGRQMHKVIWDLFTLCPDPETAISTDTAKIAEKVYSLGLQNKRAKMIQRFSLEYARGDWTNVTQLHGIGKYAADAYAIFCQGLWREVEPDDLMLVKYWKWLWETDGLGNAFAPDNS